MALKLLLSFVLLSALPWDEGQWLPQQFLSLDWEALKARGLELTKDQFWHPTKGGVLSAAVQINGCTASFCSPDGLVVTNHHCGFGAIEQVSTVERNLLRDGFAATTLKDEIPAPGMVVFVLKRIDDVTARVRKEMESAASDLERYQKVEAVTRALVQETEKAEPGTTCHVASFLSGRAYHLYVRTRITDVRLVYAPPRAVGEFGGEEDNWMWPRHTGDFSFFRAYVGPDGTPRGHAEDNVPYRPGHHLAVAKKGVQPGDLVMVMGYPGRTERYLSATAAKAREEKPYPARRAVPTAIIGVLEQAAKASPEAELRFSSRIKSLANVQKNAEGMVKGLKKNRVHRVKSTEESALLAWIEADPARKARFGTVLADLSELDSEEARHIANDELVSLLLRNCPLLSSLVNLSLSHEELSRVAGERDAGFRPAMVESARKAVADPSLTTDGSALEEALLACIVGQLWKLPSEEASPSLRKLPGEGTAAGRISGRYAASAARPDAGRAAWAKSTTEQWKDLKDPLVDLARDLAREVRTMRLRQRGQLGRRLVVGNQWIQAQEEWRGKSFYPDANSTLRVAVASVKGYEPRDGVFHSPVTTLEGLLEKERGVEPFANPSALLMAAAGDRSQSRFADPKVGDVPVCFLSDGDTTGGNSGSPIINGRGELVGLNFDRVFENVVGDFGWNADRSRNIGVDIRYVLWNLENVVKAPRLLIELGF